MFVVHNLTNTTIRLPDLHLEIGPRRIMDLDEVATRDAIDRSQDLKIALRSKKLALSRHSVIHTEAAPVPSQPAPAPEKSFDEQQLVKLVKNAVAEELQGHQKKDPDLTETVRNAVASSVGGLLSSIRDQINSVNAAPPGEINQPVVAPEKLAEISQETVKKISEGIETGGPTKSKKINIINKRDVSDLADEL